MRVACLMPVLLLISLVLRWRPVLAMILVTFGLASMTALYVLAAT